MPSIFAPKIAFETIGPPKVLFKTPETEAPEDTTPVTILFDQPVRALDEAAPEADASGSALLAIDPPISGEGRWLGTSAYEFRPSESYRKATTYTVTVTGDVQSLEGDVLRENVSWQFSGARPRVLGTLPHSSSSRFEPTASIAAELSMPPAPDQNLNEFLEVTDRTGKRIAGTVRYAGGYIGFTPTGSWERGMYYTALLKKGLRGEEGPNGLEADYRWNASVLAPLAVQSTTPAGGSKSVEDSAYGIYVGFTTGLDPDSLPGNIEVSPVTEPDEEQGLVTCSGYGCSYVVINMALKRNTTYTVTLKRGLRDTYGGTLGADYTFSFDTGPATPRVEIVPRDVTVASFDATQPTRVILEAYNTKKITYTLYKLDTRAMTGMLQLDWQAFNTYTPAASFKVKSWSTPVTDNDEGTRTEVLITDDTDTPLAEGFYFLTASPEYGTIDRIGFNVTRTALTAKYTENSAFVWAVDQNTTEPVRDIPVTILDYQGNTIAEGTTNKDGVFRSDTLSIPRPQDFYPANRIFVIAGERTILGSGWNDGIETYAFGLPYYNSTASSDGETHQVHLTMDRTLYRPGHTVHFKGIVRKDSDASFALVPAGAKAGITVTESKGKTVYSETPALTAAGTFSGSFPVDEKASLGAYTIKASYQNGTYTQQFQVEEYRRQDFGVTIEPEQKELVSGQPIRFAIRASYYFGGGLAKAPVYWTAKQEDYFFVWEKNRQYEFGQPDSYWYRPWYSPSSVNQKEITEERTTTDAAGIVSVSLPYSIAGETASKRIVIDAGVTDRNNQSRGASETIFYHKSGVYVGVKPRDYVGTVGREAVVEAVTVDPNGKEVSGRLR